MAGMESITAGILAEARSSADGIIKAAEEKAAAIVAEANSQIAKEAEECAAKAEAESRAAAARTESKASLAKRGILLAARQDVIADVIAKAKESLLSCSGEEYFAMLLRLLKTRVRAEEGEMLLSAKDLERVPAGFAEEIGKTAAAKGGSLVLSDEAADIDDGFILRYGGIEENASIEAIFREKQEALSDIARRQLSLGA